MTAFAGEASHSPGVLVSLLGLPIYLAVMVWGVRSLLQRAVGSCFRTAG
jgi:hypothetical protein